MKKISNKCNLQVIFSKRQTGVFKKTSELATLCGVDLAVIIPPPFFTQDLNEDPSIVDEDELHAHLNCLSNQIAVEKQHVKDLNHLLKATEDHI
ncbi:Agamous-like MADS-box protein AGL62 [Glycine soja]|uniref:Agamous-like MADS-box protein AGL62 n=1 Tax=Glycine soja TaxID=3848 RepID=A0A0B2S141_GLYSO|nr:Agamous-like MADS-box protein AGL62 [Glycine soja]